MSAPARLAATLLTAMALAGSASATTIVVNYGTYDSARRAAHDESHVTWGDANPADDRACTECFAATELQHYLRLVTGRPRDYLLRDDAQDLGDGDLVLVGGPDSNARSRALAPALGVSSADLARLGLEGYLLRTREVGGRRVTLIAGGGRVGTLYGVYDLLHRLGVRWYAPGVANEEVPAGAADLSGLDVREQPGFVTRGFHAWEDRGNPEFLLWMARNRLNYWCVEQREKGLLHKLGIMLVGGNHIITAYYLGPILPYPYNHRDFAGDDALPADPYAPSPEYLGDADGNGVLSYYEAHPEWYGLLEGKRSRNIAGDGGDNFCTSNPDAMTEFMHNAMADLATGRFRDADIINAWTLDGGRWCECAACRALGTPTDRTMLLVHRYAREIAQARQDGRLHRPVRLLFLAYADVLQPPTRPLPADFDYDACIATYFPIRRCYVHTLSDPACGANAGYTRYLAGWATDPARHYRGQMAIGEYYNLSGYKSLPAVYMHTMARDIPYYYDACGVRHFHYMHCTTSRWGTMALTNWQMARQLWDPATDCPVLWDDYFQGRYGPAAPQMREFYGHLETMFANISELKYAMAPRLASGGAPFGGSHLKRGAGDGGLGPSLDESLQEAMAARRIIDAVLRLPLPDRISQRVREDESGFIYGERTLGLYDALCRCQEALVAGERDATRAALAEAQQVAELLRADAISTSISSSHANAPNALIASNAAGAIPRLTALVGRNERTMPEVTATAAVTLRGMDFQGGGALHNGYGLWVYPERLTVSEVGNYVYGQGTAPADRMTAWFRLATVPGKGVRLVLQGLKCAQPAGAEVAAEVRVNDTVAFAGMVPFSERALGTLEVLVPATTLRAGANSIEVRNVQPGGRIGGRPWFGIDHVTVTTAP